MRVLNTVVACVILAVALTPAGASAQFFPSLPSQSQPASPGPSQQSLYQTAPITLDGTTLFRIAAPAAPAQGSAPVLARASSVQNILAQLVATSSTHRTTLYDPLTLQLRVVDQGYQAIIEASDATHTPIAILTVTSVDAKSHRTTVQELAAQWRETLYNALYQGLLKRQPAMQRKSLDIVIRAGIALVIVTIVLVVALRALRKRIAKLEKRLASRQSQLAADRLAEHTAVARPERERQRRTLVHALRLVNPQRMLSFLRAAAAIVVWVLVLLWFVFIAWALYLFPQTSPLGHDIVAKTVRIVAIWIVAMLANRLFDVAIVRLVGAWLPVHFGMSAEERARQSLRVPTTIRAISGFKSVLIVLIAVAASIGQLGLPIAGVVTFGGVAALAISFAAQNFLRDFLSGFLVIFEDQYAIGDFVTINGTSSGIVEYLTLRMVQLRDTGGNLITLGHGTVTNVVNRSRNWSRVDYRVAIDPSADVEKATKLLVQSIQELAASPNFRADILDAMEWVGVDAMSRDWVILRASIRTAPLRQFEVRRELNSRVVQRFQEAGIKFGAPIIDQVQTTQP